MPTNEMTLQQQVIYKLGSIEAKVESGFASLDSRMKDFHTNSEALEGRVKSLEDERNRTMARLSLVGSAALFAWTFVAPVIQHLVGIHN